MFRIYILGIIFYFGLICFVNAQSSSLRFRQITREQGLSHSTIETLIQDQQGFVWIGTHQGLNRYDGYSMKVFSSLASDSTSLSDDGILSLYVSKTGVLWVGTSNGLNRFHPQTNTFTQYRNHPSNPKSLNNNSITCLLEDKQGAFWVGTAGGGLHLFNQKENTFRQILSPSTQKEKIQIKQITALLEDQQGMLWVGTQGGLMLLNPISQSFTVIPLPASEEHKLNKEWITALAQDPKGRIWIGTNGKGLYRWDSPTGQLTRFQHNPKKFTTLSAPIVKSLLVDRQSRLWVGTTNGGLSLLEPDSDTFLVYQHDPDNPSSISQKTVSALLEDTQGNVWLGTHRGGISLYTPPIHQFALYTQHAASKSLSYKDVRTFHQDQQGFIWIGTDGGGLNRFDADKETFQAYKHDPSDPFSLGSDAVLHVLEDRQGTVWVATWGGGLNRLDRLSNRFTRLVHVPGDPHSIGSNNVWRLLEDRKGNFWVGTIDGGLNLLDRKTGKFTRIEHDPEKKTQFYGRAIISLNEDSNGNIWIGTIDGGLNCYDPQKKHFTHHFYTGLKSIVQGSSDIRVLFTDHKGRLWVGQKGLYLYDSMQRGFNLYTQQGGLDQERIQSILEDEKGYFWLSTSNGLIRFHPQKHTIDRFTSADGLQGLEFNMNASLKANNGDMYFGGINGFNRFKASHITSSTAPLPVVLTGLQLFNQPVAFTPFSSQTDSVQVLTLSYQQSVITLEFSALQYAFADKTRYAYRLDNFDKSWHFVGTRRTATYTNLDPGEYSFQVKASLSEGVWNSKAVVLRLIITPPWWKTWWCKLLFCLMIGGSALLFHTMRIDRIKRQKVVLQQQVEERTQSLLEKTQEAQQANHVKGQLLSLISHDVRSPLNSLQAILNLLTANNLSAQEVSLLFVKLGHKVQHTSLFLDNLLYWSRSQMEGIRPKPEHINVQQLAQETCLLCGPLAEDKQIELINRITFPLPAYADVVMVQTVLRNLVSNAIKFCKGGDQIQILAWQKGPQVWVAVQDNGIGMSPQKVSHLFSSSSSHVTSSLTLGTHLEKGTGLGLQVCQEFIEKNNGRIWVESQLEVGSTFFFSLPH